MCVRGEVPHAACMLSLALSVVHHRLCLVPPPCGWQAYQEKEDSKKMKQKQREKMQPKMGKMDIDYQVKHGWRIPMGTWSPSWCCLCCASDFLLPIH